jgi:hypothetical protein
LATTTTVPGGTTTTIPGGTTTTLGPTTTTTAGGGVCHLECAVTWGVPETVTLGALQFDTDYSGANGQFEGSADQVVCTDLTGSLATFNDNDAQQKLSAGFISLGGIVCPKDVMRCNFNTAPGNTTQPQASDFVVTVLDSTDPNLNPVTATAPVNAIQCTQVCTGGTTTTVSTSTTTGGSTTTTTGGGPQFTIGFVMAEAVNVGALQFAVDYAGAPGGFNGAADTVACTDQTGSLASFNDIEASSTLNAGFISLGGFSGPDKLLANCTFTQTGGSAPVPGDFAVTVTDATDPSLNPITPFPTVNVTVTAN